MSEQEPETEAPLSPRELRDAARRVAMQTIYSLDTEGVEFEAALADALKREPFYDLLRDYLTRVLTYAHENREAIDSLISPLLAKGWDLKRLAKVDRAILRLAVAELEAMPEISPKVTLNECVALAQTFGDKDSPKFVNGVFGKLLPITSKANWDKRLESSLLPTGDSSNHEHSVSPVEADQADNSAGNWVLKTES